MRRRFSSETVVDLMAYIFIIVLLIAVLFPFLWIIISSVKTTAQLNAARSMFWPNPFTLENYNELMKKTDFLAWFRNSMVVAVVTTFTAVVVGSITAFALTRLRFLGQTFLASIVLIIYLVPPTVLFIPLFRVVNMLGLKDSLAALFLTYPTQTVPFMAWMLMGFFRSIPKELDEAALIDGASKFGFFWRILLPLSAPGIIAAALFAVSRSWDEFIFALVMIGTGSKKTLPIGISEMLSQDTWFWGGIMAAAVITTIPIVIFYIYLHRYMVEGLTAGAVKG